MAGHDPVQFGLRIRIPREIASQGRRRGFGRVHRARQRLGELLADPAYEARFPLAAGELLLFDNSRVLHGRTRYDSNEGHRHLQGCYLDTDGPRERFASLLKHRDSIEEVA